MREIKIQVLQIENCGIPEEPEIYTDQKEADQRYIEYWQDRWQEAKVYSKIARPKTVEECDVFFRDEYSGDHFLRYWTQTITI